MMILLLTCKLLKTLSFYETINFILDYIWFRSWMWSLNNDHRIPHRKLREYCSLALYMDVRNINGGVPQEFLDAEMLDIYIKSALRDTLRRIKNGENDPYWKIGPNYWTCWWDQFSREVIETYFRDILKIKSEDDLLNKNNEHMQLMFHHVNNVLMFIPSHLITPKVCMTVMRIHPTYISYCSDSINTNKCMLSIRDSIRTLRETALVHFTFSDFIRRRRKRIPMYFVKWITRPSFALAELM